MTILRTKHNQENPFVMINKSSLWDENLSLEATGLWARMLSRPDDWEVRATEIANSCKINIKKVYRILKELIDAGYASRSQEMPKGQKGFKEVVYEIYEFKNISTLGTNTLSVPTLSTKWDTTNTENTNQLSKDNFKEKKERDPPPSSCEEIPVEAKEITAELWMNIRKLHPTHKEVDIRKWEKTIWKAHKIDHRSWDDLRLVLKYIFENSPFWQGNVRSAEALREKFDTIWLQMKTSHKPSNPNLEVARKVKAKLTELGHGHLVEIEKDCIRYQSGESLLFSLDPEDFSNKLLLRYKIKL